MIAYEDLFETIVVHLSNSKSLFSGFFFSIFKSYNGMLQRCSLWRSRRTWRSASGISWKEWNPRSLLKTGTGNCLFLTWKFLLVTQACNACKTFTIAKRTKSKYRKQIAEFPAKLRQHKRVMREMQAMFTFHKCFRNTGLLPLQKSSKLSTIPVCLSES